MKSMLLTFSNKKNCSRHIVCLRISLVNMVLKKILHRLKI